MSAPTVTFTASGSRLSGAEGFNNISVTAQMEADSQAFECRATKAGADYGLGKGALIASFSFTPANTPRQFDIYDSYLTAGDGEYRISLYAQGMDGSWNDNHGFIPSGQADTMLTSDGREFLCMR